MVEKVFKQLINENNINLMNGLNPTHIRINLETYQDLMTYIPFKIPDMPLPGTRIMGLLVIIDEEMKYGEGQLIDMPMVTNDFFKPFKFK